MSTQYDPTTDRLIESLGFSEAEFARAAIAFLDQSGVDGATLDAVIAAVRNFADGRAISAGYDDGVDECPWCGALSDSGEHAADCPGLGY